MGSGGASLQFYERALAEGSDYFATQHYLTHAYENIGRMDRALEHAAIYVRLAPAIPHAHHMYGHVLRRVDGMGDAIAEFRQADELQLAYFWRSRRCSTPVGRAQRSRGGNRTISRGRAGRPIPL